MKVQHKAVRENREEIEKEYLLLRKESAKDRVESLEAHIKGLDGYVAREQKRLARTIEIRDMFVAHGWV
jgi:hypothetical protein